MKKKILTGFGIFIGIFLFSSTTMAQLDCDCPEPTEADGVCVVIDSSFLDPIGIFEDTIWMPSECIALCFGITQDQIVGNCTWEDVYGDIDTTWTDCDCPEPTDSDGVCVVQSFSCGDSTFAQTDTIWIASECLALCYGYTQDQIVGNCTWEDIYGDIDTTWTDCDCPEPTDDEGVCVVQSFFDGDSLFLQEDTIWMPSECIALCYGFTQDQIVGNCTWEDVYGDIDTTWTDCDCPEPTDDEGVCVVQNFFDGDSLFLQEDTIWMPSECIALCYGFTQDQIVGNCTWEDVYGDIDTTWTDCDCPEPSDDEGVCVEYEYSFGDSTEIFIDTTWIASECLALCYGFTEDQIIGNCTWEDLFGDIDSTWTDCDCPEPTDDDAVCVVGDYYDFDSVLVSQDTFWMPSECYALCFGFTPNQIIGNCGVDSSYTYASITATKDSEISPELEEVVLFPNPVDNYFYLNLSKVKSKLVNISISNIDARTIYKESFKNTGELKINANNFIPGIYIINIQTSKGNKVLRMVKI